MMGGWGMDGGGDMGGMRNMDRECGIWVGWGYGWGIGDMDEGGK